VSFFQHPQAIVETTDVGEGTKIWAFAHVLSGAQIGKDCSIGDHTFIEGEVLIGDKVTIKCGVQLWKGTCLEDEVFVGPNVTFASQSPHPPSPTTIKLGAAIGANATLRAGLTIGQHAVVEAGAVVTRNVPPYAVVAGNPAQILRYASKHPSRESASPAAARSTHANASAAVSVSGVFVDQAPVIEDLRGFLTFREEGNGLPFCPKRCFAVYGVPSPQVRGEHAHRACQQFLVVLKGTMTCVVDDSHVRQEIALASPGTGLYVPPMVWATQYKFSSAAVLLVLASHLYDPDDYIRNYDEFVQSRRAWESGLA
jgi:UDP-2-acetamido-3-amino-2,3-dideoxy-glucuronate N-acetyltransferase